MKKYLTNLPIVILTMFILAACAGEGTEVPTQSNDALMTSAVGSMVASFFGTQTAMYTPPSPISASTPTYKPLPSPEVISSIATLKPLPTLTRVFYSSTPGTITSTGTLPTSTVNSDLLAVGCNNLGFIRDVTIPAGTIMEKGQAFTKVWKVQNTGTCNWMYQYTLVLVGGEAFDGGTTKIQKMVPVWSWSEFALELQAPKKPGTYASYWRLSNGQSMFGATLAISIVVQDVVPTAVPPTATLSPTSAPAATPTPTPTPTYTFTPTPTLTPTPTPLTP